MGQLYARNGDGELMPLVSLRIDALSRHRKAEGVRYGRQAEDMGLHVSTLYDYRKGKKVPEVGNLRTICSYYGASADWLLGLDLERKGGGTWS